MKKQTKLKIARIVTGAAITASAFGIIMFCGRSSSTHAASQFTHGLKVIGEAFGGGMYRGATVVAGSAFAGAEIVDSVFDSIIPDDGFIIKAATTPPNAPTPAERAEAARKAYEEAIVVDENIAAYDRWEEQQRNKKRPHHPLWHGSNVIPLNQVCAEMFLDPEDLDEAV